MVILRHCYTFNINNNNNNNKVTVIVSDKESTSVSAIMKRHLERQQQRNKRSADELQEVLQMPNGGRKKPKKICQRYPLYVDFNKVGFSDWIQAPQGYDAYYCQGECTFPLANHMNASNHAVLQTLVSSVNPEAVSRACCVPTKLGAQTLLYVDDEGKLVVKTYPDMTVEECGCRWYKIGTWVLNSNICVHDVQFTYYYAYKDVIYQKIKKYLKL